MTPRSQTYIKKLLIICLVQLAALTTVPVIVKDEPERNEFYAVLEKPMPDYLTDVINKPDYRMKWNGLFEGEVGVEQWLGNQRTSTQFTGKLQGLSA